MKNNMRTMSISILAASVLLACGGGGGGGGTPVVVVTPPVVVVTPPATGGTASTAAALSAITAQLKLFQGRFATVMPAATDATLTSLLDANFMQDGQAASTFLTNITTAGNGFSIGDTFTAPVSTTSADTGAVVNDATHQWFSTALTSGGAYFKMLAIKNAAGSWLLAGDQRQAGVRVRARALQQTAPPAVPSFAKELQLTLQANGGDAALVAMGVTSATVSGAGVLGAAGAPVTVFTSNAGSQTIPSCGAAITVDCVDMAAVAAGTYTFVIVKNGITYTYQEAFLGGLPATLATAQFPVINPSTTAAAGYISGATVAVNWTVPAAQNAVEVYWSGMLSDGTNINAWVNAVGGPGAVINSTTTLPLFPGLTLTSGNFTACSSDANAVFYCTQR